MNILFEQIFARSFDAKRKFERNIRIYIKQMAVVQLEKWKVNLLMAL